MSRIIVHIKSNHTTFCAHSKRKNQTSASNDCWFQPSTYKLYLLFFRCPVNWGSFPHNGSHALFAYVKNSPTCYTDKKQTNLELWKVCKLTVYVSSVYRTDCLKCNEIFCSCRHIVHSLYLNINWAHVFFVTWIHKF